MSSKKLKVGFVVQRYGKEVTGGAELHARWLAGHLKKYWDIDVITTKAIDYVTWRNEYKKDKENLNGIDILRFPVDEERNIEEIPEIDKTVFNQEHSLEEEIYWNKKQGPYSTKLLNYLKKNKSKYDAFVFFTYLYATTYFGLPLVKEKAFLIPTAHNEPPIYLDLYKKVFKSPLGIIPSTVEEIKLIHKLFNNEDIPFRITGIGINVPDRKLIDFPKVKEKYDLKNPYMIYMGRIDPGKGSHDLFEYFQRYKEMSDSNLDLVLTGKAIMDIPKRKDIKFLGFVSEEEKFSLINGCQFLINPSAFESLSMIIMEAWLLNKPVLVNGRCEVLKGQCRRSNGGLWYENYEQFKEMIPWMLKHNKERKQMGENGKKYVQSNYSWEVIEQKFLDFIPKILRQNQ
jgi:glycosyltransferase involved in cell wall biosynthesis